jgi:hypothetical protein
MGVVFSPEQLRLGQIPLTDAHIRLARAGLKLVAPEGPITAGVVYGSVASGTEVTRSDVDLFLRYDPDRTIEAHNLVAVAIENVQRQGGWAPLEHHMESNRSHELGLRSDYLYFANLQHTVETKKEWVAGDPLHGLHLPPITPELVVADVRSFLTAKLLKMSGAYTSSLDYKSYQRALELPGAIGRKICGLRMAVIGTDYDPTNKASMTEVVRDYFAGVQRDSKGYVAALSLIERDSRYTSLLNSALEQSTTPGDYSLWLQKTYQATIADALYLITAAQDGFERSFYRGTI